MQKINENKIYHMAKVIWKEHFSGIMLWESYWYQIRPQIELFCFMPRIDRKLFMQSKSKMLYLTLKEIERIKNK